MFVASPNKIVNQACEACDPGTQCLDTACTVCSNCQAGTFKAGKDTGQCAQCEAGKYNPLPGKTSAGDCISCPAGSDTQGPGKTSQEDCTCKKEFYSRGNATLGTLTCNTCPAGAVCNVDRSCSLRSGPSGMSCDDNQDIYGVWTKDGEGVYSLASCPTGTPVSKHSNIFLCSPVYLTPKGPGQGCSLLAQTRLSTRPAKHVILAHSA